MKKRIAIMLCLAFVCCAGGCEKETAQSTAPSTETEVQEEEAVTMKLYINDTEVPVGWENNAAVEALAADAGKGDIVVNMSMYGGNEQFGPLGKSYPANNRQVTTSNGDIVLFNNDQIVVFYGSNTWSYTKLGKMALPEDEVTELLSNGDITLRLTR